MLIGRTSEQRTLERLVAGARVGRSGVLVLTGEAGIGKTALLECAAELGTGMQVLRAVGSPAEQEVAFGGLLQVLRPALGLLEAIPQPQAAALGTALALRPGSGSDRFAVGAATLSLLSRYAQDRPLAVLLDNADLLDRPSAEALAFAARRLMADPICLLAATRSGAGAFADLPALQIGGLDRADAAHLVAAHASVPAGDELVSRLHTETAGNPLALIELATDLLLPQRIGPPTPLPVPQRLLQAYARRLDLLDGAARVALLLAAAGGGDLAVLAPACDRLGVDVQALDAAEAAHLVRIADSRVAFRHPLIASAVYLEAAPDERRRAHQALAESLPEHEADRRAWHRAEASLGPDEHAAAALEAVGTRAGSRRAHAVAATAFERAARLSRDPGPRERRLVAAGESAWLAGQSQRAEELLRSALDQQPSPAQRIRIHHLRGTLALHGGSVADARLTLVQAAADAAPHYPDLAVELLADAVQACFYLADGAAALQAAADIETLLTRTRAPRAAILGPIAIGMAHVLVGHPGADRIRDGLRQMATGGLADDDSHASWAVIAPLWLRESGAAATPARAVLERLRTEAAIGTLPVLLFHIARDDATGERWTGAQSAYDEAVRLARETGQRTQLALSLAGLAWLQARLGDEAGCRSSADEAIEISRASDVHLGRVWALLALGELDLAAGRMAGAIEQFERLTAMLTRHGVLDVDLSPGPELAEALQRTGREGEAHRVVAAYAEAAQDKGQPWARARAERAAGLLARDADLRDRFEAALELHARTPDAFERARTLLAFGGRLRRARARVEARGHLRAALDTFDRLGASPWAELAAVELRATGETAQRRGRTGIEELTPQEQQIALLLAEGRTTRQAAAALFLSPKTVEYHLRHVYTKLGVRSRDELAAALQQRS